MTREINGRIRMVVSDDGTRCAAECPHYEVVYDGIGEHAAEVGFACKRFDALRVARLSDPRPDACIAAEQAAASVPSCEGIDEGTPIEAWSDFYEKWIPAIAGRRDARNPTAVFVRESDGTGQWLPRHLVRLPAAIPASAQSDHLDGGARSLDASEALREARVQGMRETMEIVRAEAYVALEGEGYSRFIEYEDAEVVLNAAIEAVRKGER